jgi:glycosyltransferase involved in cell wall biosynthesis
VPYDNRILHKECKSLAGKGYEVTLVAPYAGTLSGLGKVRLHAVKPPRSRAERLAVTIPNVLKAAIKEDAALYHFHDPELIGVGIALKAKGKKVIYDVHEDVPRQMLSKDYMAYPIRRAMSTIAATAEAVASRTLDGIVVANPDVVERFPERKTVLVQNYPILDELARVEAPDYARRGMNALYVGSLTTHRGVVEMISAMHELRKWNTARLIMGGAFSPTSFEQDAVKLEGWDLVDYRGFMTRDKVSSAMNEARVGLAVLHPVPNYTKIQPTKLFEYMAAGVPVITSDLPAWRSIIEAANCGLAVDPMNPSKIAEAIDWIFSHPAEAEAMGRRGRDYAVRNFSWSAEADKLYGLYERLLEPRLNG